MRSLLLLTELLVFGEAHAPRDAELLDASSGLDGFGCALTKQTDGDLRIDRLYELGLIDDSHVADDIVEPAVGCLEDPVRLKKPRR